MAKAMSIAGMVVAGLVVLMFGFDLLLGFPFGGQSKMVDVGFLISGATLGYLSWDAMRESQ